MIDFANLQILRYYLGASALIFLNYLRGGIKLAAGNARNSKFSFGILEDMAYICNINQSDMKILHTSDWHLGQQFHNYDRAEEQRDMLRHRKSGLGSQNQLF